MKARITKPQQGKTVELEIVLGEAVELGGDRNGLFIPIQLKGVSREPIKLTTKLTKDDSHLKIADKISSVIVGDKLKSDSLTNGTTISEITEDGSIVLSKPIPKNVEQAEITIEPSEKNVSPTVCAIALDVSSYKDKLNLSVSSYSYSGLSESATVENADISRYLGVQSIKLSNFV